MARVNHKREAEEELIREVNDNEYDEIEDKKNDGNEKNQEKWKSASSDVLAERRILKPTVLQSSFSSTGTTDMPKPSGFLAYKTNPFAALSASTPSFQPSPSSPKPNPFSSQNPPHNPFMSFDRTKGFDFWGKKPQSTPSATESIPLFAPPPPSSNTSKSSLTIETTDKNDQNSDDEQDEAAAGAGDEQEERDDDVDDDVTSPNNSISNGEAGEECLLRLRVKLYRFRVSPAKSEWVEMGVGPLKLLRPSLTEGSSSASNIPSRIVMRRENDRRGSGTKLLANLLLSSTATVGRQTEKSIRLTCFTEAPSEPKESNGDKELIQESTVDSPRTVKPSVVPTSYLFKIDTVQNTDNLLKLIDRELTRSKAFIEPKVEESKPAAAPLSKDDDSSKHTPITEEKNLNEESISESAPQ